MRLNEKKNYSMSFILILFEVAVSAYKYILEILERKKEIKWFELTACVNHF